LEASAARAYAVAADSGADAIVRALAEAGARLRGGRQRADVCSSTNWIRFLRPDGSILHEQRHRFRPGDQRLIFGLYGPGN
jgi:hypothetical protein